MTTDVPPLHIEGMGWLGAALAYRLHRAGVPFTWHDTDTGVQAWQACTGLVPPCGDPAGLDSLNHWHRYYADDLFPAGTIATAVFGYASAAPPHAATYTPTHNLGWLRLAPATAYTVDVPAIVTAARRQFAHLRTPAPPPGVPVVVAHGHTSRRKSWIWGWSAPVRLALPAALETATAGRPTVLYGRAHRWAYVYAYPMPSRPGWHLAGSAMMAQRTPRPLDAAAHMAAWRRQFTRLYPGCDITATEPPVQGWRPKAHLGDDGTVHLRTRPDQPTRLTLPPMGHHGVRLAPALLEHVTAWALTR